MGYCCNLHIQTKVSDNMKTILYPILSEEATLLLQKLNLLIPLKLLKKQKKQQKKQKQTKNKTLLYIFV